VELERGVVTLNRYDIAVSHSTFHRSDRRLLERVEVKALTLQDIFMVYTDMKKIDLLILNCEGAELYALDELARNPHLASKVVQICVSFHCPRIYPTKRRDDLLDKLSDSFHIHVEPHPVGIPDHLLLRKQ